MKAASLLHTARPWWITSGLLTLALFSFLAPWRASQAADQPAFPIAIIVVNSAEEAQAMVHRLESGADFAQLAREKSTDPTANEGGYIGELEPSSLRPELREALQGVVPGHISKIVRIPSGYAILKILPQPDAASRPPNPTRVLPLTAPGTVRLSPDIGGFTQANIAMAVSKPKDAKWGQDLQAVCEVRRQAIPAVVTKIEALFQQGGVDPEKAVLAHFTAGELWAYQGRLNEAIQEWQAGNDVPGADARKMSLQFQEALGLAYLYRASAGEAPPLTVDASYLFPTHPGALHPNTGDLQQAIAYFLKCLETDPSNLEVKWLLNLCYLIAGKYPSQVPRPYLLPLDPFRSKEEVGHFVDVAPAAGLNIQTTAGGAIVEDFDGDGLLDVVTSEQDDCAPLHYFHNNGDGTFRNRTAIAGLSEQLGGLNITQADYNNDGCTDILVLRGGWEFPRRLSLLRNDCHGAFTDVTEQSGLAKPTRSTQSAVWTDINNDGKLDLFIANENAPSELFLNQGDGTFVNISQKAGVDRIAFSKGVAAGDYDNDGYTDLYVSNLNGHNFLYHNNGNGTFTEVAANAGVQQPWASFATWFFDYDNDGLPDLFVTSYYMSTEETVRSYLHLLPNAETLKLYKNLGNGRFRDITTEVGLNRVFMPMGSNFGDIDNDGFLDIYLGNGNPSFGSLVPNILLHNKDGKAFVDVTASSGTGAMAKGHGVAFADLDNDGDEDLLVIMGGAVPGDRHRVRLFENPGNGNDWISLQLTGVKSNRSAIGARIQITVTNGGQGRRTICRTVGSGGSFGASPLQQHIGLGKSAHIESVDIWWPASQSRQTFSNIAVNQFLQIQEFATGYTKLVRQPFRLGGAKAAAQETRF